MNMDPISAGATVASSLVGGVFQTYNNNRAIRAQKEENERARAYNERMVDKQNRFSVDMWRMNNDYNSPSAQMSRLKAAGLNPNLVAGSNFQATAPVGGVNPPSPVTDHSALANGYNPGSTISDVIQNELLLSQKKNIDADTAKKNSENDILQSDAKFRDAYNAGVLETQNVQIRLSNTAANVNEADISLLRKKVTEVDSNIKLLDESALRVAADKNYINANKRLVEKNIEWFDRETNARISQMLSSANLSNSEVAMIRNNLNEAVATFKTRAGLLQSQHRGSYLSNQQSAVSLDRMSFELDMDKDFAKTERILNAVGQGVGIITDVVGAFSPFKLQSRQNNMNIGMENRRHDHQMELESWKSRLHSHGRRR